MLDQEDVPDPDVVARARSNMLWYEKNVLTDDVVKSKVQRGNIDFTLGYHPSQSVEKFHHMHTLLI